MKPLEFKLSSTGCKACIADDVRGGFYISTKEDALFKSNCISLDKEESEKLRDWLNIKYPLIKAEDQTK